jgi:flagellar biogenesis protein FliO
MMQDVSLAASFGRLGVVAALMVAVFFLLRRVSGKGGAKATRSTARPLELIDRQALGKSQSVAVFKLHDYTLVVGVTEQRVELLSLIDPNDGEPHVADVEPAGLTLDRATTDEVIDLARIELDDDTERFLDRLRSRSAR